jgi:regulator of protease activity HflC (stomatin/prohibitin superfamily)
MLKILLQKLIIVLLTKRGLIERPGKYHKLANPAFHWIIPVIDRIYMVNVTGQMLDAY